tara:strand:+ start:356 stop:802 length:447 start_codon:yes stop_codon:yes gene_type:complete
MPAKVLAEYNCVLGAYSSLDNAERAVNDFRGIGIKNLTLVPIIAGAARFRVLTGPYLTRQLAEEARLRLKDLGLTGVWLLREEPVQQFDPITNIIDHSSAEQDDGLDKLSEVSTTFEQFGYDVEAPAGLPMLVTEPPEGYKLNRLDRR